MIKLAIIGAGTGGLSLVKVLARNKGIQIAGICDIDRAAPGLTEAVDFGIKIFSHYKSMLAECDNLDLIINVTKDPELPGLLAADKEPKTEVIHGVTAELIWQLIKVQQDMMENVQKQVDEMNDLYQLGLMLSSSNDLTEACHHIIHYATLLTKTPAGSIAVMNENSGEMELTYSIGFSDEFNELARWKMRPGGLTSHILNQTEPVIIPDVTKLAKRVNPELAREGVKSIIATPLTARGKIMGILYVDDFELRAFSEGEASILGLLAGYAALSIEKIKLLDDTRKMAITDGLTGLHNQQEFLARLDIEVGRANRYDRTLSVVGLDIDRFKQYNDEFGHLAGNDLLRLLAKTISKNCRKTDLCARIGGEEFAVTMPETSLREAVGLAERLRRIIEDMYAHRKNRKIMEKPITVSMGVATFPDHGTTPNGLYRSADEALYKAKQSGRNCVIAYPDLSVLDVIDAKELLR